MALATSPSPTNDRKRVKVYELRDNDWYDRGTGFCTGQIFEDEPFGKIFVESEDPPQRLLLESKISKEDTYQKQQETLIVWTEPNGKDMALSFQEAEGCAIIWEFLQHVQAQIPAISGHDDAMSDDALDSISNQIMLPPPELSNLPEIENAVRATTTTQPGRDALSKFVIRDEYILRLLPLVAAAEDLESLPDLHRLCNIMKSLILLNDNTIIELVVSDHVISGVVGALEYDPEFPTHKANHRQYLNDRSRYKEVVPIKDPIILRKIRHTWRLQYLKDVVLARILDDPTFSVLNSLIFFNQVDIVQHLQANTPFLTELFALFSPRNPDHRRREDAVQFIHQCASIAKNLQASARGSLFGSLISHGLFSVIAYAVKHPKPALRTTGIDILVALLDHDPIMMRGYMLKAVNDGKIPLTETLIDLLHAETDLGVKNQVSDAIKVLLDPQMPTPEVLSRIGGDFIPKLRSQNIFPDAFVQNHFDESAKRLFLPLKQLELKSDINNLSYQEVSLLSHLVDILTFFVRQHLFRSRSIIHSESLAPRVAQLLTIPQKHLKLTALKFFRCLISLQDTFYYSLMTHNNTFELILNIVCETMPRDNLLNSACLELFESIKRENIKPMIFHVVEHYREKMKNITYVDTFQNLMLRYDQMQGYGGQQEPTLYSQNDAVTPNRTPLNGAHRWQGVREMDAAEEEYFDASDDEEDEGKNAATPTPVIPKPLVDYPDDDDDDAMEVSEPVQPQASPTSAPDVPVNEQPSPPTTPVQPDPLTQISFKGEKYLERFTEKRRREEDEDDELVKLSSASKRRGSSASISSVVSASGLQSKRVLPGQSTLKSPTQNKIANKASSNSAAGTGSKKISISLSMNSAKQISTEQPKTVPDSQETDSKTKIEDQEGNDGGGNKTGAV